MTLANRGDAQAIVAVTRGGGTARRLSALRPRAPIIADHRSRRHRAAAGALLGRGAAAAPTSATTSMRPARSIGQQLVERGLVAAGAAVVFVSISPDLTRSDANYLKIQRL